MIQPWLKTKVKAIIAVCSVCFLTACSSSLGGRKTNNSAQDNQNLTVFAAASLTAPLEEIAKQFETENPGFTVHLNFAGSQTLVDQISQGAPADLLLTANEQTMNNAVAAQLVTQPVVFATNTLTMITQPGNPEKITGLDHTLTDKKLVICAIQVPCGEATNRLAQLNNIVLNPVSEENKVSDVQARVLSGEADAGIVYHSDAQTLGLKVATVNLQGADTVINRYPVALAYQSKDKPAAKAFSNWLLTNKSQNILHNYGFGAAEPQ